MTVTVVVKQKEKGFAFQSCRLFLAQFSTWLCLFLLEDHLQQQELAKAITVVFLLHYDLGDF